MNIKGKNILITGGAGFIGSALAQRLSEENAVTLFDNLHRNALSSTGLLEHPNVQLVTGDVLDQGAVQRVIDGQDITEVGQDDMVLYGAIAGAVVVLLLLLGVISRSMKKKNAKQLAEQEQAIELAEEKDEFDSLDDLLNDISFDDDIEDEFDDLLDDF